MVRRHASAASSACIVLHAGAAAARRTLRRVAHRSVVDRVAVDGISCGCGVLRSCVICRSAAGFLAARTASAAA
jgi:hypothetical protein